MKRLVLFICTILCANVLSAQLPIGSVFYYENIMYEVTSENEVKVCHPRSYYEGGNCPSSIEIPSVAIYHVEIPGQGIWHEEYSVTSIGNQAFYDCSSLTSVTIPNSVTSIEIQAFSQCSSLTSVTIPNSVTSIGIQAFEDCSSLTSVTIPESVTSIGGWAFVDCSNLTILNFNAVNCGDIFNYEELAHSGSPFHGSPINTIIVGENVQRIPAEFASSLYSLTSVTIPNSVTSIGENAFSYCNSLTSVTIPNSVTSIGESAFSQCSSLTSIDIPNSVTSIGGAAFAGCRSLISVTIGNSVTSIEDGTFADCSSLTSVTIPNSVTSIGEDAFAFCSSLISVAFGESIISIGRVAFSCCSSLTSITIPNSVTYIGEGAFGGCSSLTSITFGESLAEIGANAFATSSFLQNITCLGTNPPILYNNSFPYPNIATVTVPCGSLEAYSAPTSYWNTLFTDRIEEDCSGLEDAEFAELSVYPNPTRGKVSFNQAIEKIEVIDLSGKTLQTYENVNEINIESLPAGVYHLRLTIEDKTTTRKVIKE